MEINVIKLKLIRPGSTRPKKTFRNVAYQALQEEVDEWLSEHGYNQEEFDYVFNTVKV